MTPRHALRTFWRRIRGRADQEIEEELRAVAGLIEEEKQAAGLPADAAHRLALVEIGGIEQVKELARQGRPGAWLSRVRQDLTYSLRLFRRAPAVNAAILFALAVGIGATAATFSVVDGVLLRPLAYADADRLVVILHHRDGAVAPANFLDWRQEARAFSAVGAAEFWTPALTVADGPQKLFALHVSADVLPLLGVAPAIGRFAAAAEEATREVVIGDGLWRREFAGDPGVIGRPITLDGDAYVIVGVMPSSFRFAPFWATRAELWAPLDLREKSADRSGESLRVFARLAPRVSLAQARASMTALAAELERRYPGTNSDVTVTPLKEMVVGQAERPIVLLFIAVSLVLLIACANVAHLLLIRAASREKEVAVRAALGAGRARLLGQFMTESLVLAIVGAAAGLVLAKSAIDLFKTVGGASLPRVQSITLDSHVLAFGLVLSVLTAVLFGLAPALKLSRPDLTTALQEEGRSATESRRGGHMRRLLIGSEVALAVVLLVGAGLLIRSFVALRAIDPGWVPDRLASMIVSVAGSPEVTPNRRIAFYEQTLARLQALPGVESASGINHVPLVGDRWVLRFYVEGRPIPPPGKAPGATYRVVLPGYFGTMQLPIILGRGIDASDRAGAPPAIVVNEYLAKTQWPGESPIGKRIRIAGPDWRTVVGVATNAVRADWNAPPEAEVYLPLLQDRALITGTDARIGDSFSFVFRTSGPPERVLPDARAAVRSLSPTVAISDLIVMTAAIDQATLGSRFLVTLLGLFAAIGLALAAVGIYGVMSHTVESRRREIGIRLALGATRRAVVTHVVRDGLRVTLAGVAVGTGASLLAGSAMSSLLVGVTRFDVPAFFGALAVLLVTATLACYLPARRVARTDLPQVLR
jgi:predicted permease